MKPDKIHNKKLYKALENRELRIDQVAKLADISSESLRKMLNGKTLNPGVKTVKKLSDILKVNIEDLGFF